MNEKEQIPMEIERKYLIRMPDLATLTAYAGVKIKKIKQTYLESEAGVTARVREVETDGKITYIYTEKRRRTALTAEEREREITAEEYAALLARADGARRPIRKTRYALPYAGHIAEVDIYDFWNDRATAEIELSAEDEAAELPPCLQVIREVTADRRYKHAALAREVVFEDI